MDESEVVSKMKSLLGQSKGVQTNRAHAPYVTAQSEAPIAETPDAPEPHIRKVDPEEQWLTSLPEVPDDSFLLEVKDANDTTIFCVKELDWQTAMNIDMKSFRVSEKGEQYYSEEYERRQTMSRAIVWVANQSSQITAYNKDGYILDRLSIHAVNQLWQKYKLITSVTTQEAQRLYDATKKYLNNEAQEGVPIPSVIPETIAICDGWSSLSLNELKNIKASDWERMQIVKMARTDLMGVYTASQISGQSKSIGNVANVEVTPEPKSGNFDMHKWAESFPIGHPNRPLGT